MVSVRRIAMTSVVVFLAVCIGVGVPAAEEAKRSSDAIAAEAATSGAAGMDQDLRETGNAPAVLRAPGLSKGVDSIIAAIRKREVELARREQKIAERERTVVELESRLEKRAGEIDRIREEVEQRISSWVAQGQDRTAQLASVYSAMPPAKAGALLNKLELDLAVAVVRAMKKKSSAGVLAAMRPDRALLVSRRLLRPLDPNADAPAARR